MHWTIRIEGAEIHRRHNGPGYCTEPSFLTNITTALQLLTYLHPARRRLISTLNVYGRIRATLRVRIRYL